MASSRLLFMRDVIIGVSLIALFFKSIARIPSAPALFLGFKFFKILKISCSLVGFINIEFGMVVCTSSSVFRLHVCIMFCTLSLNLVAKFFVIKLIFSLAKFLFIVSSMFSVFSPMILFITCHVPLMLYLFCKNRLKLYWFLAKIIFLFKLLLKVLYIFSFSLLFLFLDHFLYSLSRILQHFHNISVSHG